jgi:alcohol dehydrogenase class IV
MSVYYFPVKIISADGCLKSIGDEVVRIGARYPLIITDPGIVAAGIVDKVIKPLKEKGIRYTVFEGVEPDPKLRNVASAVQVAIKEKHDLLIGLGGGSSIDTTKATSVLSVNEFDLREHQGPQEAYPKTPLPIITIPTTAGTGSEVSSAAMIVDEEKDFKMFIKSPQIFPKVAFLDAEVLIGIPNHIAAATGADTLSHAIESLFNPNRSFITETASLGAINLVFKHLRAFVANTKNRGRAQNMMNASCLAGIAMTTAGLGLVHALAHPLGIKGRISHGVAYALFLPHVLRFNWIADSDQFMRFAHAMDWTIHLEGYSERDVVLKVIEGVENLLLDIGLPRNLSEAGASLKETEVLVDEAISSFLNQVNPRPASRKQVEDILKMIL